MIIKTEDFKDVCSTVLAATDGSELSTLTETLELKTQGSALYLNVTNKEYYVSVKFPLEHEETFHAAVNATLFLKLISQITSDSIELTTTDKYVMVKANGNYKIPLIYENDTLVEIPEIVIANKQIENVQIASLESIVNFNTKQLNTGTMKDPVQKMFYIDEAGCITFTSGACVNNFTLPQPMKLLLPGRIVNLFKLFKGKTVNFALGHDASDQSENLIQTKVSFVTDSITLTAITGCNDALINKVPAAKIRAMANAAYSYSPVISTQTLLSAINRLMLFSSGYGSRENLKPYCRFVFNANSLSIYDSSEDNVETFNYENKLEDGTEVSTKFDISELKKVLDGCTESFITLNVGQNSPCCVITRGSIQNVIPAVRER